MSDLRFFDPRQPQTLQGAVLFSYLNGAIAVLSFLSARNLVSFVLILAGVGALGIANERRWGYWLAVGAAVAFLIMQIAFFLVWTTSFSAVLNVVFAVFLLALLLSPISRAYQRSYFH